jgi:3D (Asp-Asp-Asp) domain-containing protein
MLINNIYSLNYKENIRRIKLKINHAFKVILPRRILYFIAIVQFITIIILIGELIFWNNWYKNSVKAYGWVYTTCRIWIDDFRYTGYTLAEGECGKNKGHPQYGITNSGFPALRNLTVAVDKNRVPLGSFVLPLDNPKEQYVAHDTGNGVKGLHIDVYCGNETKENLKQLDKFNYKARPTIIIERRIK